MKNMKNSRKIIAAISAIILVLVIYSCTSDTEYLKYAKGGEISYSGAIDSLQIMPGKNRVKVEGLIIGDPKISELRVYWNNNMDSLVLPVIRSTGIDSISTIIEGLEEKVYNFVVRTFDNNGNSSIPVSLSAEVYGARYLASLLNTPLLANILIGSNLTIDFAETSKNSGSLGSEVEYTTTSGTLKTIFVDRADSSLELTDFESGSTYRYRTAFVPVEESIDNFYTDYKNVKPIPTPVLGNAKVPFTASATEGRWGVLGDPWITNDAEKNHDVYGGWDEWNGNIFNLESGWGAPGITNGKIYQVVNAEPAKYQLKVKLRDTNHSVDDAGGAYFVITKGNAGLPDVEDLATAPEVLAYKRILGSSSLDYVIEFTLDETSEISVGELTTQSDAGRFANIISYEIVVLLD